jgi:glycosyltransferase involved in cell wall biosynthesis
MHICTIVARNYLAAARVLARSFREHHPEGTCWTLVIDDVAQAFDPAGEPFELVRPEELSIELWDRMAAGYTVLELSTAVKPWLLRYLLDEHGVERITYLDPDIQVFDSLADVDELLRDHAVVVYPHLTAPMPRDGRKPTETDILSSGSFNLGFAGFAAGDEVDALFDWWAERLATDCLVAPERGYFVDQRWMDFAPGLVSSLAVLRDPGYNVAYWNLTSRDVARGQSGYTVNGRPLRFFHFSGYDPDKPDQLSKHQDRIRLSDHPVVRKLCDGYARALADERHAEYRAIPYGWGALPDGTPLDQAARAVYRDAVKAGALSDERIFTEAGGHAFLLYLWSPADHGGEQGVTRYLEAVRDMRADLRDAFTRLDGPDGQRLVMWAHLPASGMSRRLLGPDDAGSAMIPGVRVAGYFHGVMGVGEHARQLAGALRTQGIPVSTVMLHPEAAPEDAALAETAADGQGDAFAYFNLLCANADSLGYVAERLGEEFFEDRYTIGFWAWEVSAFPDRFVPAFRVLDEVWVGSRHVRDAVAKRSPIPVLAIPQPVSLPRDAADAAPPPGLPDGFTFLFAFDYLSVFARKNPLATIEAFTRAFAPGSGATLIVKSLNHDYDPAGRDLVRAAIAAHPDVHLIEQRLTSAERNGLISAADCYVSLHRAEGFGYTMAEAMWLGKPVVATGYSGNVDYMTGENSYLIDYRLVPIGPGHDPYPADGKWAEPDTEHAARLLREVFENREEAARRGRRAAADIRKSHGPEPAGRAMAERLQRVMASPAWRAARRRQLRRGPIHTEWVNQLIRSGPVPPRRSRFGAPRLAARKGLLRLLKPVTVHERIVTRELLNAIETVDANVQSLALEHEAALREIEVLKAELKRLRTGTTPD